MLSDTSEDLEGHYSVQRSRIDRHPEYDSKVLITQFGWAKRGKPTQWYETIIEPLNKKLKIKEKSC
jgi:hypothetical protein